MTGSLIPPQARRVIPRSVVDALIGDADHDIATLEHEAVRARRAADEAEARLSAVGVDERSAAWATVQLDRFIARLRADIDAETAAIVDEAAVTARLMVEEARAEVEAERTHRAEFTADDVAPPVHPVEWAPPAAAPAPAPTPAPLLPLEPAVDDPAPPPAAEADPTFRSLGPDAPDAADTIDALDVLPPTGDHLDFWPAETERRRRFAPRRRGVVVAQGLALVLVVAAAAVRFV